MMLAMIKTSFRKIEWKGHIKEKQQLFLSNSRVFVVFTNIDLHVERIYFDNEFWQKVVPELSSFYSEYMLPEL